MKKFYLGIDGGGTKTEAVLCDEEGNILSHLFESSTNANDVGVDIAIARLTLLIQKAHDALAELGCAAYPLCVFGGIAGALNRRDQLLPALKSTFSEDEIGIHTDAINLLSSELYRGDGCCMICGTGSVCFVRNGDELKRIAGWGYLLDRSGSGFSMGREALEAALRSHDGRGDATLLTGAVMEKLGGAPWDKLSEIYEGGKPFIASFAPCVISCAEEGDRVAFEILYRQAIYLAECLDAAYNLLDYSEEPLQVVLGGGVFRAKSDLPSLIEQNVTVPINLTIASAPPVFGAVWEAVRNEKGTVTSDQYMKFKKAFMSDYAMK